MNMSIKRFSILIILSIILATAASAQKAKLRRAKTMMENLEFIEAIRVYSEVLQKKDNAEAKINIAECYRKINDAENAEYWYGQVVRLPEAQPMHMLYYGEALQRNGKCEQAKERYTKYNQTVPNDVRGQELAKACDLQQELMTKNGDIYVLEHMQFNSNLDDFGPTYYEDGLVFSSERDLGSAVKREHTWTGLPFLELYYTESKNLTRTKCTDFSFSKPKKFSEKINSKYDDAAVSFNADFTEIYFTRNNFINGKTGKSDDNYVKLKIYTAKKNGNTWGEQESLPFNSDEYSVAHPALSTDGNTLYFSSDMPGGFGGMDLYKSVKENGRWSPPTNLGPEVNTEGNELFPVYHKSGKLYFSSNGHKGLGGLDIYVVTIQNDGKPALLENVGFPLNTTADDFGMVLTDDGLCGFLSSDREGGTGRDDIYGFKKTATPVEVFVYDAVTKAPIKDAQVHSSCRNANRVSNEDGKAFFDIKIDECCDFTSVKIDYNNTTINACAKGINLGDKLVFEIPMQKTRSYKLDGVAFDQSTGLPLEGATVTLVADCTIDINGTTKTGADGRYSFSIPQNCTYKVKAEKDGYLADFHDKISTLNLTDTAALISNLYLQPTVGNELANNANPVKVLKDPKTGVYNNAETGKPYTGISEGVAYKDGKITNKTTMFEPSVKSNAPGMPMAYLLDIYYDFDKYDIREEAESELTKLQTLLQENPKFVIEICSFTDARGSDKYNKKLSQNRAQAVVNWLVAKGISKDRLIPKGYGEAMVVNGCVNDVKCDESKHQMNRRTEFKVVGCKGCKDQKLSKISKPNDKAKVDPCPSCPF